MMFLTPMLQVFILFTSFIGLASYSFLGLYYAIEGDFDRSKNNYKFVFWHFIFQSFQSLTFDVQCSSKKGFDFLFSSCFEPQLSLFLRSKFSVSFVFVKSSWLLFSPEEQVDIVQNLKNLMHLLEPDAIQMFELIISVWVFAGNILTSPSPEPNFPQVSLIFKQIEMFRSLIPDSSHLLKSLALSPLSIYLFSESRWIEF